ncbi:MAG: M3 family oligoendopeptidase [Clostridiales bacterium]|nr:M3 family oligoendopeptidase [Clostridiales bacterium]
MTDKMRWDLSQLYTSFTSKEFTNDKELVEKMLLESNVWADNNLTSAEDAKEKLEKIIKVSQDLYSIMTKLFAFTSLTLATNAQDEEALSMMSRLEKIDISSEDLAKKITRFIGKVQHLDKVVASSKLLSEHAFYINEHKQEASHLLAEEVEPVISKLSVTGAKAWTNMRNMMDGVHEVEIEQDGVMKSLPLPIVRNMAYSPDGDVRKKAYEAELESYKNVEVPMSHALNAIKGEANTMCELRGYENLEAKTLEDSRMDKETLDAMLSAMVDFMPEFRRYLKAKAKALGHTGSLPFYDLFAPMGGDSTKNYTYEQAHSYLVEVFAKFSPEMSAFIDNAFKDSWIDSESRAGKGGGAFCANLFPIKQSRVLSNFDGSFSQVSTLAHELGHAWHGHCLRDKSILNTSYPMPLAETASIFNECFLADIAKQTATDEERFALLESELMEATQVIVDIYSRYLFETEVVNTRLERSMNIQEFKDAMICAQKATYGDGLDEEFLHPYMWACKTHYYERDRAFYNWPYAFGLLFGKGVFAEYRKVGDSFVEDYKALLAATGSANALDVAKRMNIDLHDKAFWNQSLTEIKHDIDEFCILVERRFKTV